MSRPQQLNFFSLAPPRKPARLGLVGAFRCPHCWQRTNEGWKWREHIKACALYLEHPKCCREREPAPQQPAAGKGE